MTSRGGNCHPLILLPMSVRGSPAGREGLLYADLGHKNDFPEYTAFLLKCWASSTTINERPRQGVLVSLFFQRYIISTPLLLPDLLRRSGCGPQLRSIRPCSGARGCAIRYRRSSATFKVCLDIRGSYEGRSSSAVAL